MTVERDAWRGLLDSRLDPVEVLVIEQPLSQSKGGGSGSFPAEASDGRQWWVKPANNLQGGKVIVTENLVGSLGKLIGAPTCEVAIVRIPEEIAGFEFVPGHVLEAGLTHASRGVEQAQEFHSLEYRQHDHNARRHAGVFALYDWCWGGDPQWLCDAADDQKLYSHDHGWYLPPEGQDWTETELVSQVDQPRELGHNSDGLESEAVEELAERLDQLGRDDLLPILSGVPESWPVANSELEALGFFLERRAPEVGKRLRQKIGGSA